MKLLAFAMITLFSTSTFAIGDGLLIKACHKAGVKKLQAQARYHNLRLDMSTLRTCGIDNRLLNPSKYVWFCATSTGGEKRFQALTQKSLFSDCF